MSRFPPLLYESVVKGSAIAHPGNRAVTVKERSKTEHFGNQRLTAVPVAFATAPLRSRLCALPRDSPFASASDSGGGAASV